MFRDIRYQNGEVREVAEAMKKGSIPCLDVEGMDDFNRFAARLNEHGIFLASDIPYDKAARDVLKEPEFEFRAAFRRVPVSQSSGEEAAKLFYIDVYFEEDLQEDYDPIGEIR